MSTQPSIHPKEEHKEENGLDDKDNNIKAETEDQKKKAAKPKKRRKRRRASSSEAARDEFDMWQTVQQRYGTKKVHNEIKEAMFDPTTGKIFHPSSYERMMARSVEAHLNRMLQPESPEDLVDSKWLCAFCFKPTCANDQGELYGPYFIRLSTDCQPPDELLLTKSVTLESTSAARCRSNFAQEEAVNSKKFGSSPKHPSPTTMEGSLDIWLHGDCALWAPELFLVGGRLPTLQFHIHRYWKQPQFYVVIPY
uniref:Uncharacterized protein n=1 Tax=Globodera rostochiensis TaxID=31243 RepID=A0A914HK07_GLORO